MSELSFPASSPSRRLPLAPSPLGVAWAFSYLLAPSLRLSRSLALTPYQRIARRSRLPYYDSSTALGARSIHGIASWFSEGTVDCRQPRQTAHRSHALSLVAYSPTGSPTGLASPSDPLLVPSLSLSLSFHSPSSSPLFPPPPLSPLRPATTPYTLSRGCGASQLHGARQLRNNNNTVRRCVASCGARHRNATPWIRA